MGDITVRYVDDKPKECKYCYFWDGKVKGCTLGGVENCHYLIRKNVSLIKITKCDDCPYKRNGSCIGWCTKDILQKKGDNRGV